MKIQNRNQNFFAGGVTETRRMAGHAQDGRQKKKGFAVFAGGLRDTLSGRIEQKRQEARKKASKIIREQFSSDQEITKNMETRREDAKALAGEKKMIQDFRKEAEKTLELAEKWETATPEEETEKKTVILEQEKLIRDYNIQEQKKEGEIGEIYSSIADTKRELLKHDPMVKAQKNADAVMDSAADQIKAMIWEDAKDTIDENLNEKFEEAKEAADKKEEQKEKLEGVKEDKKEAEALTEQIQESAKAQQDIQNELKKIMQENELLEEEMKGLMVDSGV